MPASTFVKVNKHYQITIPADARRHLGIKSGDRLLVHIQDGMMLLIREPENYTAAMAGLLKEVWNGVDAPDYIDQERETWTAKPVG